MCVYNRECVLNSVKLRVEVSVICVCVCVYIYIYIVENVCVTGNVWFMVDNTLCSWQMRLRLQVSVICNGEELIAISALCTGAVYLVDQSDCDI